jgi:peptide/nickel transport system ATP-binding protein
VSTPALRLAGVSVAYEGRNGWVEAVREVDLVVEPGQTVGLVGESGSGKTTVALAVLGYLPANGRVSAGRIEVGGRDVATLGPRERRDLWRHRVKLVPQNPLPSLNPAHRVGRQLLEGLEGDDARKRIYRLLEQVGLADPDRVAASFPHELSGGMQQRVMIAMALASEPDLLVLDEPTTNLDVTTEVTILDLVRDLIRERNTAVLFVSHSLGVVAQLCDRVAVLYAGDKIEDAAVADLYQRPLHPYTRGLLDSVPRIGQSKDRTTLRAIPGRIPSPTELPSGCIFAPRCPVAIDACRSAHPPLEALDGGRSVRCIRWRAIASGEIDPRQAPGAPARPVSDPGGVAALELSGMEKRFALPRTLLDTLRGAERRQVRAVDGIDLRVEQGATVGLVGESGSGKSTLARAVIGLNAPEAGEVRLLDLPLARDLSRRPAEALSRMQMVFQSSDEALNPYHTVGHTLRRPVQRLAHMGRAEADVRVAELLRAVQLTPDYASRRPDALSGGEKQRVAIARAFASDPDLLLFDESVSGLDVSVQAAILNLLSELQNERGGAYLFISHDLAVVAYLADVVAVIYLGQLMEVGPTADVLEPPYHPYTEALLSAIPLIDAGGKSAHIRLDGEIPSPVDVPRGCRFHTRCHRIIGDICRTETPPWQSDDGGNRIACHIPLDELRDAQQRVFTFEPAAAPEEGGRG